MYSKFCIRQKRHHFLNDQLQNYGTHHEKFEAVRSIYIEYPQTV